MARKLLLLFLGACFLFSIVPSSHAQRSIFRSVEEKKEQERETQDLEFKPEENRGSPKPALDPLSLLGDRPKTLVQAVQVPPEYGRISETYQGNPKPLVIHIQDVHVHYEAQKNLANILDKLIKQNGLRLILVEGGSGDTSLSFLRSEASKEKRLEVAEKYLKAGKISGEEYLDITSDNPITLWGIEDEELYDKNLDIFFKVDAFKEKALKVARSVKAIVETLKVNLFSPRLKELEREKYAYEEGKGQAVEYYQYLGGVALSEKVDLSRYPNFKNFLEASVLEKKIDFQKVDGQHQALIGKLTQVLSKGELTSLAEKGLKYKLNEAGPKEYYGFLKEILKQKDPAKGSHQDLDLYIDYILLYADRDHVELFREGKILEKEIKGRLYTSNDERTLSEISDRLDILLNFLELNLSPEDLHAYQQDRQGFPIKGWKKFLVGKMQQYKLTLSFPEDTSPIDNHLALLESFYETGMKRDNALVENAISKMNGEHVDVVVLIAGGFHTAQITRLLREQNYSYMVIAPKITQPSNLELYHEILKEKAKPATPADENLRQLPALERGVPRFLKGDLERGAAQDGQGRQLGQKYAKEGGEKELTVSRVRRMLEENLKVLLGDREVEGVHQFSIPQDKKVAVVQLKAWDPDFYAGNLIGAFEQRGNTIIRMTVDRNEEALKALRKNLRKFRPDFVFLPLHDLILRDNVEQVLGSQGRSAIFIFYKSLEVQGRFNLVVPFTNEVAAIKEKAIKAHLSQHSRLPYHLMARNADTAHALEFGLKHPHAEIYVTVTLKGGKPLFSSREMVWGRESFKTFSRGKVPLLVIAAHPDDIAIMGGALVYLSKKYGMDVQSWILSTGSGAYMPEIDEDETIPLSTKRLRKAEIREKEEKNAARWLGTDPPNLIGTDILRQNPEMPDEEIVRQAATQLRSNLKTFLGMYRRGGKIIILLNDPNDPHPRHRAVYEESMKILKDFSKEEKGIELQLVYLTFPEGENFNGFFPFKTATEITGPTEELKARVKAARLRSKALATIAREVVTVEGKGSKPRFGEDWSVEGIRIEPFGAAEDDTERTHAKDGGRGKETAQELQDKIAQLTSQIETASPSSKFLLEREIETLKNELALRRRRGSSGPTTARDGGEKIDQRPKTEDQKFATARDGGYKILGDPRNIIGLERAAIVGDQVVFDVREGFVAILPGARIIGRSYIQATKDHAVEIGVQATVESSFVSGALVGDNAVLSDTVLETTGNFDDWSFDRKDLSGKRVYTVSGNQTRVGPEARISGARVVNTTVGRGTEIESGVYQNSDIGRNNRLRHIKMTLVHTEHEITLKGTPELPLEVSEAWLGYKFYADKQAFIDSALHTNEIVSLRFDPDTRKLKVEKSFSLPAISHMGRNVVDSSYLGTLNPLKAHTHGLYEEFKEEEMIRIVPRDPKALFPPVRIRGIDGSESSAHGYLIVDPLSTLSPFLRWIALGGGQPSADPLTLMANRNLTHATPFSLIGSPVRGKPAWDDWGMALPGAAKFGLSRKAVSVPFLFIYSPDTIFTLMQEMVDALPDEKKSTGDDFPVEMLETGKALVEAELAEEKAKFRDDQDHERIALLEKWRDAYRLHIDSGAWRYRNGEKDPRWKFENGLWTHEALDLKRTALEGVSETDYRQTLFKELPENDPKIPRDRVSDYEPILTAEHLPEAFEPRGGEETVNPLEKFGAIADIDPTAVIGNQVEIEEGAVIGPGVILEGKTVIRKGAKIFGSHLIDTTVGEETFVWGSGIQYARIGRRARLVRMFIDSTEGNISDIGNGVRLSMGRVQNTFIGDETEGSLFLAKLSNIGKYHLLEPYATVLSSHFDDSTPGVNRGIGSLHVNVFVSGLYTNHHLAGRALNVVARPITFRAKGKTIEVANAPNWGGGSTVVPDRPDSSGRIILETTFVGTNTIFEVEDGEETYLGFGSIVAQRVKAGEHLIHFTQKLGPGPQNDIIGGVLLRPDLVLRHILSKTKSATKNPLDVDLLMEAKIQEALEQVHEELTMVRAGQTHHPVLGYPFHSEEQLKRGIDIFEDNLDGRWRMENHKFVNGFWLFKDGRYSWNVEYEAGEKEAVSGGKVSYVADIGTGREGQESRTLVHPVRVGNIEGDLIAVIDGHYDEEAAHLIKRKLPSIFENALREKGENFRDVYETTDRALLALVEKMDSGAIVAVAFIRKVGDERRVSGFGRGDAWLMIADQGEIRLTTPEQNPALDEEGRNIALAKGAVYHEGSQDFGRAARVGPYWRFTNSYGDRRMRPYLREEAWFLEGELPLGDQSTVLLGDDGVAYDLKGKRQWLAENIAGWAGRGEPANAILNRRNDQLSKEAEVKSHREWNDNRVLIVHQPETIAVRDGAERYVARDPEWLMAQGKYADRTPSEELKRNAKPKFHLYHSSLLREDLGESFSLALDHLADATGNPRDNRKSLFKNTLIIDDSSVTSGEIDAYLAKHALRPEQFSVIVTQGMLFEKLRIKGTDEEIAEFLRISPENLEYRLRAYGKTREQILVEMKEEASMWYGSAIRSRYYAKTLEDLLWEKFADQNIDFPLLESPDVVVIASRDNINLWKGSGVVSMPNPRMQTGLALVESKTPGAKPKIQSKVRMVVFDPSFNWSSDSATPNALNLASFLVNVAAEVSVVQHTWQARGNLGELAQFLKMEGNMIQAAPIPIGSEYRKAYETYLNSV